MDTIGPQVQTPHFPGSPGREENAQIDTVGKWLSRDKKPDSQFPGSSQGLSHFLFEVSAAEPHFHSCSFNPSPEMVACFTPALKPCFPTCPIHTLPR